MSAQHSISAARKRTPPVGIAVALTAALAAAACAPATGQSSNDGAGGGAGAAPAAVAASEVSAVESCAAEQRWGTDPRAGSTAMTAAPRVRERRPFRVWISSDAHYQHVVLDIAH